MGDPAHLDWLLEGVQAWNARRVRGDFRPNLEGLDIRAAFRAEGADTDLLPLAGIDLSAANIKDANLCRADLSGAKFVCADLRNADLSWSVLKDSNLICAKLEGTKIYFSDLRNANWSNSKPWEAILYEERAQSSASAPNLASSIQSVEDAIRECKKIYRHYSNLHTAGPVLYFRGESNSAWELRPPVRRQQTQGINLHEKEGRMLVDLMSHQPEAFDGHSSALSQWVLAQHHGLKTRLIDINRNLAVALFFTCGGFEREYGNEENDDKDGRLHIFAVPRTMVKPFDSDTISVIANFGKLSWVEQETLLGAPVVLHTHSIFTEA